jgi:hypothetical protein
MRKQMYAVKIVNDVDECKGLKGYFWGRGVDPNNPKVRDYPIATMQKGKLQEFDYETAKCHAEHFGHEAVPIPASYYQLDTSASFDVVTPQPVAPKYFYIKNGNNYFRRLGKGMTENILEAYRYPEDKARLILAESGKGVVLVEADAKPVVGQAFKPIPGDKRETGDRQRLDDGKSPFQYLPPEFLFALSDLYGAGAKKYAPRGWEKGMSWSRCFGALMRHAWKFWRGEDYDQETGAHHMVAVAWNAVAIYTYFVRGIGEDDRAKV